MPIQKKTLYILLSLMCLTGYVWLFLNYVNFGQHQTVADVCIIKHVTGIPCPSCGSTRSILAIIEGNYYESLILNPIGILLFFILLVLPPCILYDFASKKSSFFNFFRSFELFLKQKPVAIFSIFLISINWIWNIYKGL